MSENLEDYEITPDDLGCMGEKEIDDGVKEEAVASGSGETKVPIPKSFASIPFEVKKRAREMYDAFDLKDMSFEDFCVKLYALQSPRLMQADLQDIIANRHDRNRQMAAELHNIDNHLN